MLSTQFLPNLACWKNLCNVLWLEEHWLESVLLYQVLYIHIYIYRVFQRKTWCFELLVWLGFWRFGLLIKLGVVLSSGNLCLINHLKLFWPQTASAVLDKKCRNSKLFLLNFCPSFYFYSEAIWLKIFQEWQLIW